PEQAACADNIVGPITIPEHPLVRETIDNCLHEAMDVDGLAEVLACIGRGEVATRAVDTAAPSPMSHEILNSNPYTYLDDAPLEERRALAVALRRTDPDLAAGLGALDLAAITEGRALAWPHDGRGARRAHRRLAECGRDRSRRTRALGHRAPRPLHAGRARGGVVRAPPPGAHPPPDPRPPAAGDRARLRRRPDALSLPLAARAAGDAAAWPRRAARGGRPAAGARAAGARLGDPGTAGAHRALRPRRSRRPLSRGCGGMGPPRDRPAAGGGRRSAARQGADARGAARLRAARGPRLAPGADPGRVRSALGRARRARAPRAPRRFLPGGHRARGGRPSRARRGGALDAGRARARHRRRHGGPPYAPQAGRRAAAAAPPRGARRAGAARSRRPLGAAACRLRGGRRRRADALRAAALAPLGRGGAGAARARVAHAAVARRAGRAALARGARRDPRRPL